MGVVYAPGGVNHVRGSTGVEIMAGRSGGSELKFILHSSNFLMHVLLHSETEVVTCKWIFS